MASSLLIARTALAAAREIMSGEISISEAVEKSGVGRTSITSAQIVLKYGNEMQIIGVTNGKLGLHPTSEEIKKHLTREERKALFPGKKPKSSHKKQAELNNKILEAAQITFDKGVTIEPISLEYGLSRGSITLGRILLMFASSEEMELVKKGELGLQNLGYKIRNRMTPEQKKALKNRSIGVRNPDALDKRNMASSIWANLGSAIANLATMPDINSVISIVKSHPKRKDSVNAYINIAKKWLEEFAHEWEEYNKSGNNLSNPGNGSGPAGTKHTESST